MSTKDIDLSNTVGTTSVSNPQAPGGHDASDGGEHHHSHGHGGGKPAPADGSIAPGTGHAHHHGHEGPHRGHVVHEQ